MKIAVAIPTHETVPFSFAYHLAGLSLFTAAHIPEGVEFGIEALPGTYVHKARCELAVSLYNKGMTHILWLDSDMRFPRDSLFRLLRRMEEDPTIGIVGINYAKRGIPTGYVAIKEVGVPGEKCATTEDSTGVEEVEAIGFGMVLMRREVLADLPDPNEVPWFQNKHMGGSLWMGEDVFFCELLRRAGHKIYVDHDLSKLCAHIGQFEYELAHVTAMEEAGVGAA